MRPFWNVIVVIATDYNILLWITLVSLFYKISMHTFCSWNLHFYTFQETVESHLKYWFIWEATSVYKELKIVYYHRLKTPGNWLKNLISYCLIFQHTLFWYCGKECFLVLFILHKLHYSQTILHTCTLYLFNTTFQNDRWLVFASRYSALIFNIE